MTLLLQLHGSATHKPGNDPNCPICVRRAELQDALDASLARKINSIRGPNDSTLEFYSTRVGCVIVQWFGDETEGFEVYAPLVSSNKIADTLNALRSLGAVPCHA